MFWFQRDTLLLLSKFWFCSSATSYFCTFSTLNLKNLELPPFSSVMITTVFISKVTRFSSGNVELFIGDFENVVRFSVKVVWFVRMSPKDSKVISSDLNLALALGLFLDFGHEEPLQLWVGLSKSIELKLWQLSKARIPFRNLGKLKNREKKKTTTLPLVISFT